MILAHGGTAGAVVEGLLLAVPLVIFFALNALKNRKSRAARAEEDKDRTRPK
ncbi:MAG: hypothetical protein H0U16_06755 [Actinobacteria bacterium]|nr:hypothetical protein [Actinomycetota bacterium]